MRISLLLHVPVLALMGCGPRVEFLAYRGPQNWPTGSAFIRVVKGTEVYEGLPDRPYAVVGMIDIWDTRPFFDNANATRMVLDYTKEHQGDAIVWLSSA